MVDEKGDFIFSWSNFKKYDKLRGIENINRYGGCCYTFTVPYCQRCSKKHDLENIPEKNIKAITRDNKGNICFRLACSHCGDTNLLLPFSLTPFRTCPYGFQYIISDIRISSRYIVRTRLNGGNSMSKLYSDNSDNWSPWHNNWGKIFLPSIMEYANSKNIPVEVTTNAVVRW